MSSKSLTLPSRLTAENANHVAKQLIDYCLLASPLIDLSEITHCDSAGLSALIMTKKHCETKGITVVFNKPSQQLLELATFLKVADWLID